ncbi:wings apart-like protein 1 isoform X3 [Miscanthus floridulus]|uniref:wings apart-like protein 1 isoform X3 n=1 Tax=Miscanthus floridulus TaxID=154761 RepID=UPI0034599276
MLAPLGQYANLFREQAFASGSIPRMRRASLLTLLGIYASAKRHCVLRSQGLVQQIINAILVLDIDDPPCTIAAGALLFVLASDRFRFSSVMQSPPSTR